MSALPFFSCRPARPATWLTSWKVRSPARRSPPFKPRSASTTPTKVRFGKLWPLATICVPIRISISLSSMRATSSRTASPSGVVSEEKISMRAFGKKSRTSSSMRSTPGPIEVKESGAPAFRAGLRLRHRKAGQVADQPARIAVLDQPGIAFPGDRMRWPHACKASAARSRGGSCRRAIVRRAAALRRRRGSASVKASGPSPAHRA